MIKLAIPDVGEAELGQIREVFESKYLVQGNKVEEFENIVSEYLNAKHVIAVSNGTAALHLALMALDIKSGDEVIVPDFTFPATSNVVEVIGASTRFVDIKLDTCCIDINQIENQITQYTKAIIPVHEFGQSADMDKIMELARKYSLRVIEDAACALGTEYKGTKIGSIGDIGCFSLHPRKAITTGEGGLVVTNNDELAEKIRILRNHGISTTNGKSQFIMAGLNYRLTNIQGAMGIAQMNKLEIINNKRKKLAELYNKLLKDCQYIKLPEEKAYGKHVWQTYHIILDTIIQRDELIVKLKNRGIETNFGAYAVHDQPYYKTKYGYNSISYKNSLIAHQSGLALPLHTSLDIEQIHKIVFELRGAINE